MNSTNAKESLTSTIDKMIERQQIEEEFDKRALQIISHQKISKIDSFTDYFEFLHNNFLTPVYYEGILYPSVTHAYHAARSNDETTRRAILNAESFHIVAKIAIRIIDPEDWSGRKLKVMEQLIRDKFRRSKELQNKLKSTENRELIMTYEEANPKNLFWGMIKGAGQNQLGRILMKIRDDLNEDKSASVNPVEIFNWITSSFDLVEDMKILPEINLKVNKDSKTIDHIVLKNKSLYKIGLFPQCDLVLQHPSVSRLHAVIICEKNLGVILIDLRSKSGTKLDGDWIKDNIPYRLKTGKKLNFAMSTRDYFVEIDVSKIKQVHQREKVKLEEEMAMLDQMNTSENKETLIKKAFGIENAKDSDAENDTIYVKNIPYDAIEEKLNEIFTENFGNVKSIYWPVDRETGYKKHFAFIQFEKKESAREAVDYGLIAYEKDSNEPHQENEYESGQKNLIPMLKISYAQNSQKYRHEKNTRPVNKALKDKMVRQINQLKSKVEKEKIKHQKEEKRHKAKGKGKRHKTRKSKNKDENGSSDSESKRYSRKKNESKELSSSSESSSDIDPKSDDDSSEDSSSSSSFNSSSETEKILKEPPKKRSRSRSQEKQQEKDQGKISESRSPKK